MAFSELIKNFDKIRDYMRDFYIYGFKARGDFAGKSARTYDNEKRRIESYLTPYVRWENDRKGKRVYISLDAAAIDTNPLYNAWKAKSFTDNDITLHFAILAALEQGAKTTAQLTDAVCTGTGVLCDLQTVRNKANEYARVGLLTKTRANKADCFALSPVRLSTLPVPQEALVQALWLFQEVAPFGFVGSTLLDQADERGRAPFGFKHHYMVHTLEDGVLLSILQAVHAKRRIAYVRQTDREGLSGTYTCVPLQVFVSAYTGRRYACVYTEGNRRYQNCRLDSIQSVTMLDACPAYDDIRERLERIKPRCWGVSFGGRPFEQQLCMTLHIEEATEQYVLERLKREGRGGTVERIAQNTYQYVAMVGDASEAMPWVKTFVGRILSLEGSSDIVLHRFMRDMRGLSRMYGGEA